MIPAEFCQSLLTNLSDAAYAFVCECTRTARARAHIRVPVHFHSSASFLGFLWCENNSIDVWRRGYLAQTWETRERHYTPSFPLSTIRTLHTCKHRRSWHIWPHIQGRTINFAQKEPLRTILYRVCRQLRLTWKRFSMRFENVLARKQIDTDNLMT